MEQVIPLGANGDVSCDGTEPLTPPFTHLIDTLRTSIKALYESSVILRLMEDVGDGHVVTAHRIEKRISHHGGGPVSPCSKLRQVA